MVIGLGGCGLSSASSFEVTVDELVTVVLEADENGLLVYCDETDQCEALSNPDSCGVLVVKINTVSGEVCESCQDQDGTERFFRCSETVVVCTRVPEPDCVRCAFQGETIVYSSCDVVMGGCGDSRCATDEDCSSCPADCGACSGECGDGNCGADEDCTSCPADCGACPGECGDNNCGADEDCTSCPADCGPCPLPGDGLALYGVKFGGREDFAELALLGVNNPVVVVSSDADVDQVVLAARTIRSQHPHFKPILWLYPEGWDCGGINAAGQSFVWHLNDQDYWGDILAIYGLHEPLGGIACASLEQARSVTAQIVDLSGGRAKIFGKMYSDTSYAGLGFADGLCDYCGVLYHPFRAVPREYRRAQMLADLERDLRLIKSVPSGQTLNKAVAYLCTIEWPVTSVYGTGLYMPSMTEMEDAGEALLSYETSDGHGLDGLVWYTWANNSAWIGLDQYDADGQRGDSAQPSGRVGVIARLSEDPDGIE